jgi:hypothetical protein
MLIALRIKRAARRLAEAKKRAREFFQAAARGAMSRDERDRLLVPALIEKVRQLAEEHRFPLHEIGASKERFQYLRYRAERPEALLDGKRRLLDPGQPNAPLNVINPAEPGTDDIEINKRPAPETGPQHPIDAMIDEVIAMGQPPPGHVEVFSIGDDGRVTSRYELENDEGFYFEIVVEEDVVEAVSLGLPPPPPAPTPAPELTAEEMAAHVDRWFETAIIKD